jgi:hypothetical protein
MVFDFSYRLRTGIPKVMKKFWAAAGLLLVFTLVLTYPLVLRLGDSVRDKGDPLLNTWILSRNVDRIAHLRFAGFFDANIFYPEKRTLAYSELLLPQSLVALPLRLLSRNPVLAHNLVLILGLLTTGLGMYFLARYLTGNGLAGLLAGMVYAFSPFMLSHLYQVQILWAGGIPLALLFLHKFLRADRLRDLMLFVLFFILQALANVYFAFYLMILGALFVLVFGLVRKKVKDFRFLARLALAALVIVVCLGPFYYQYYRVQKEMNFRREILSPAKPASYLATTGINRLYGRLTERFREPERALFPGIVPLLLASLGAATFLRLKRFRGAEGSPTPRGSGRTQRVIVRVLALTAGLSGLVLLRLAGWGGFDLRLGKLGFLRVHNPLKTGLIFLALLGGTIVLRRLWGARVWPATPDWGHPAWVFALTLVLAVLFSFGASGPYLLLHKYVPGFDGLRVAARFDVLVMLALAVLAAYGLTALSGLLARRGPAGRLLLGILPLLLLVEYFSGPVPYDTVPVGDRIPEVYRWLAAQPGHFAVVELPLPARTRVGATECPRLYYSTYHHKQLLNGYSGFFPPVYDALVRRYETQPVRQSVRDFRDLGARMIIFHASEMRAPQARRQLKSLAGLSQDVRPEARFGDDTVFEILPLRSGSKASSERPGTVRLPREGWSAAAGVNETRASLAIDGSLDTRWDTAGPQEKGQWFELDLGRAVLLQGISLKLGPDPRDYPRGIRVETSPDSVRWTTVAQEEAVVVPIRSLLRPGRAEVDVSFKPATARFLRLVQTGRSRVYYWSIAELELFGPGPGSILPRSGETPGGRSER